jgi:methyl-accepting chemotaxis protein
MSAPLEPEGDQNQTLDQEQMLQALQALRAGDLSVRMPAGSDGTAGEIAATFNELVDMLSTLALEVARITREVGTEGRFGGQAEVEGLGAVGIWTEMTHNINVMSANLTNQVRDMYNVTRAALDGDVSQRVTVGAEGETSLLKNNINTLLHSN